MNDRMNLKQQMGAVLVRPGMATIELGNPSLEHIAMVLAGKYGLEHWRKGRKINEYRAKNGITNEGMNKLLDVMFHAVAALSTWYIGLITDPPTLAAGDTLASHAGWTEFTDYTGNRLEWTEGAASGRSITNATTVDFPITGSGTVAGAFLASVATGTSGTLWSTGLFNADVVVQNGDTLKVTYTLSG